MEGEARPNLSLGEPPKGLKIKEGGSSKGLLLIIFLLQAAVVAILIFQSPKVLVGERAEGDEGKRIASLKAVAMELEEKSLDLEAASAWERLLEADPDSQNQAQILYRTGKLYMGAGHFSRAASAFVRAELLSEGDKDLKAKIGPKLVDCLRNLGLYGEVGRELSRRVEEGADDTGRGETLATFAGEALTEADLDRMIERQVDQMLAMQGTANDGEQRTALLRQLKAPKQREQLFQQLLQTELFSRRARELKLDREEDFVATKEFVEQNLLASRFLQQALEKIQPTDVDLQAFYQAFKENYKEPESVQVLLVQLEKEEDPERLLESIQSAEDFKKLAADRDKESGEDGPTPWEVQKGSWHSRLGYETDALFELEPGAWTRTPLEQGDDRYLAFVEAKTPERIPGLDQVRDRVMKDYIDRKQREVAEAVFKDLMARYEVKILAKPGEAGKEPGEDPPEETGQDEEKKS